MGSANPNRKRHFLRFGAAVIVLCILFSIVSQSLNVRPSWRHTTENSPPFPTDHQTTLPSEQHPGLFNNASVSDRLQGTLAEESIHSAIVVSALESVSSLDPCSEQTPFFAPRGNIKRDFLREIHHYAFGRAWALGRDIYDHLTSRDLKPTDRFLDFGSGALRNGIWLIPFLDVGHYYGIEYNTDMFLAGKLYELPLHGLEGRQPNLFNNVDGQPNLAHFGVKFDKIMAFAVLIHLNTGLKRKVLREFADHLAPQGTIFLSHRLPYSNRQLEQDFGLRVVHQDRQACKWSKSTNVWFELQHVNDGNGSV